MRPAPVPLHPARVRYIKLGTAGGWEAECLSRGIIRIGFNTERADRFRLCQGKRWSEVTKSFIAEGKDKGTATRFTKELRLFFEDDGTTLWISFMVGRLQWGMLDRTPARQHDDGKGAWRRLAGGWRDTDLLGNQLSKDKLSGALTKLAAYRGTSCDVDVADYVIRRINGQKSEQVERALTASVEMTTAVLGLVRMLSAKDFELLVDLLFTTSGWRRLGDLGRTQDTVDFDLILPSTRERAFVQIKSKTSSGELAEYVAKLGERADLYRRMFYVYHSGEATAPKDPRVTLIGPEQVADMVLDAGLTRWLIEKVS